MPTPEEHEDLKTFLLEKPAAIDADALVQRMLDSSGAVGGLSIGLTLDEVTSLGFEPSPDGTAEHVGRIERPRFVDSDPRHRFEYVFEDEQLCSVTYELEAPDADLSAVAERFSDTIEDSLGAPIVFENTKHWMIGDDAQCILRLHLQSVAADDGDEFGFAPETTAGSVSLQLWNGEGGEFPGSFDSSETEAALRAFVSEKFGDKIELGDANIWMEAPYVYFNLIVEVPDDELDFDWKGVPLTGGKLDDEFKELVIENFNMVLDLDD